MAAKKSPVKRRKPVGRPSKGATTAAHIMSVRWTEEDWTMLEDLVADQEVKVAALGVTSFSAADMLRLLVREEHRRRGLMPQGDAR